MTRDDDQLKQEVELAGLKWEADHHGYITLHDYFGDKPHTPEQADNATELLKRVNALLAEYVVSGGVMTIDQDTGTYISGAKGGSGDGGFRLPDSTTGAPNSRHRKAQAVDVSDQHEGMDVWLSDKMLTKHGLYRESSLVTITWVHFQSIGPLSGRRTYIP